MVIRNEVYSCVVVRVLGVLILRSISFVFPCNILSFVILYCSNILSSVYSTVRFVQHEEYY